MTSSKPKPASAGICPPFDPASEGWSTAPEAGFVGLVGPFWSREDDGVRRFGFLAEERHSNLTGVVQGGMLMTFADRVLGVLAWSAVGNRPSVTISFDMQFVGAGRIGSFIEATGEVVRRTPSLVFMRGLLVDGERPVASCSGVWKVLADRTDRGAPARTGKGEA